MEAKVPIVSCDILLSERILCKEAMRQKQEMSSSIQQLQSRLSGEQLSVKACQLQLRQIAGHLGFPESERFDLQQSELGAGREELGRQT